MTKQKLTDKQFKKRVAGRLEFIYSSEPKVEIVEQIYKAVVETKAKLPTLPKVKWDETDSILITYGDSIKKEGELPLVTLHNFLKKNLSGTLSTIHILPFFPYSSDDGFSVIDYTMVNPELGTWKEIEPIAADFKFMADLVVNHISQHSTWFQNYLKGVDPGKDFFIEADPATDLSKVVRPRSLPLLTEVETANGKKHVWTTFSADQIDVNFGNEQLLVEMVKIFLLYLSQGSSIIRLDAIAFLWKEIGTNCLHLPQTHEVVKLMRDIMDFIHPSMVLLTETNVPNKENLSYFGNNDEANMVYQFSLPPLLLHALFTGNAKYLTKWA
ncbi:MAG: alpha-amylase family glycosyl hydrolase, partial [Bacteroidales bacterium]|nr:alpha-amylase family glycosyl hydrolase [Bacteroidales bacterium]